MKQTDSEMTTPSRELTREQIAPALAEAQGWVWNKDYGHWEEGGKPVFCRNSFPADTFHPMSNDDAFLYLTLDPEIHAGMIDVLDEWLAIGQYYCHAHNPEYLQDIRLWQLRACVEFLIRRGK